MVGYLRTKLVKLLLTSETLMGGHDLQLPLWARNCLVDTGSNSLDRFVDRPMCAKHQTINSSTDPLDAI